MKPLHFALCGLLALSSCGKDLQGVCYMKKGAILGDYVGDVPEGLSIICDQDSEYLNIAAQKDPKIKSSGFIFNEAYKLKNDEVENSFETQLNNNGFFLDGEYAQQFVGIGDPSILYYTNTRNDSAIAMKMDRNTRRMNLNLYHRK